MNTLPPPSPPLASPLAGPLGQPLAPPLASTRAQPIGYRQIAALLEESIRFGRYKVGDRLQSEEELAREFGVARLTVRRALDVLSSIDLVDRRRRRGTVVRRTDGLASVLSPLSRYMAVSDQVSTRYRGRSERAADESLAGLFRVPAGTPIAELAFDRRRGDAPLAMVFMQLPPWVAEHLPAEIVDARQANQALADAGIRLSAVHQSIGAQNADPELARQLAVAPGSAVLRITRIKRARSRVFQSLVSYFRADMYEYDTDFIGAIDEVGNAEDVPEMDPAHA